MTLEQERDMRTKRAEQHGWNLIQVSECGTMFQLIRGHGSMLFTIEIGLGICRRFGWTQF